MGEADRHRQQWVAGWKESHGQWANGVTPHKEHLKGADVFRNTVGFLLAPVQGLW